MSEIHIKYYEIKLNRTNKVENVKFDHGIFIIIGMNLKPVINY